MSVLGLSSLTRSFEGRPGPPVQSPLLLLSGRPELASLLALDGEAWPSEVNRRVDLDVYVGSMIFAVSPNENLRDPIPKQDPELLLRK